MTGIHKKGDTNDYSDCLYLLRAWESSEAYTKAMELAQTAEVCIFAGAQSLPFMRERLKLGLLSFDMGERWLKKGLSNMLSPNLLKIFMAYHLRGWKSKPLYKLCMSAFAKEDYERLRMYKCKCFKWGYFTQVDDLSCLKGSKFQKFQIENVVRLMWCARFIDWKHPEMPILLANRLKENGCRFHLAMYGDGPLREKMEQLVNELGLRDYVHFMGNVPNEIIHQTMRETHIFLFTSDREEGWGAVANEAMSEGCLLIGADEIGAVPYLVKDGENGFVFKSKDLNSLYEKVSWAIEHQDEARSMAKNGQKHIYNVWSPRNAALSLMQLINDLSNGKDTSVTEGPCSKA